jgi:hypothetical protein
VEFVSFDTIRQIFKLFSCPAGPALFRPVGGCLRFAARPNIGK